MHTLTTDKKHAVLNALLEGLSIRATSRLTGVTKKAIMRLLVITGEHCERVMDDRMRDIRCTAIEADELWCYVGKKQKNLTQAETGSLELGDQYTFVAFDPDSKLVPSFLVSKRTREATHRFMRDLRSRVVGRTQIST